VVEISDLIHNDLGSAACDFTDRVKRCAQSESDGLFLEMLPAATVLSITA
jgi:hypothetical protein